MPFLFASISKLLIRSKPNANPTPAVLGPPPAEPGVVRARQGVPRATIRPRPWLGALSLGIILAAGAGLVAWHFLAENATAVTRVPRGAAAHGERDAPAARITSPSFLRAVLARDTVRDLPSVRQQADPVAWLEGALKVDDEDGADFLTVTLSSPDPREVLVLVSAVADVYQHQVAQAEYAERRRRALELDQAYAEAGSRLIQKQEALARLAESLGVSEPAALARKQLNLLTQAGEVRKQLVQVRSERRQLELRRQAYQARSTAAPEVDLPQAVLAAALAVDPAAKQYLARIERLEAIVALYEQHAVRKDETTRVMAEQQIADLQKKRAARREALRAELMAQEHRKARSEFLAGLVELDAQTECLHDQEQGLEAEYRALETEAGQTGRSLAVVEQLRPGVAEDEKRADRLHRQVEAVHAELRSPSRPVRASEVTVHKADSRRQILGTVLASLVALGVAGLGVWWLDGRAWRTPAPGAAAHRAPRPAEQQARAASEHDSFRGQVERLLQEANVLRQERDAALERIEALGRERDQVRACQEEVKAAGREAAQRFQAERERLVQALRQTRARQEETARDRDQLAQQLQALRDELGERRGQETEQERGLEALRRELEAARAEVAGQQRQLHTLRDEQAQVSSERDQLAAAFAAGRQQWDQERAVLQREGERLRREASALRQARDAALRQADSLSPELDPLASYPGQSQAFSREEEQRLRAEVERLTWELEQQRAEPNPAGAPQPVLTGRPGEDAAAFPSASQAPAETAPRRSDEEWESLQKELTRLRQALVERDTVLAELRRQGVAELDNYWATEGQRDDPVPVWTWRQREERGETLPTRSVDRFH